MYRSQFTIFEMLRDRGYCIDQDEIPENEFDDDVERIFEKNGNNKIFVTWHPFDVGVDFIKKLCKRLEDWKLKTAFVIKRGKLTPSAKTTIIELSSMYSISIFDVDEVQINITKHTLVPKHELLTKQQADEITKIYKKTELPHIKSDDPVVRYYGWRRGSIIKITRRNGVIFYRLIV